MNLLKRKSFDETKFVNFTLPRLKTAKNEKTICNSITFTGIVLHSGKQVTMSLSPAPINTGYVFRIKKKKKYLVSMPHSRMLNLPNFVLL